MSLHGEKARAAGSLSQSHLLTLKLDRHIRVLHVPVAGIDMIVGMMCTSCQL